MLKKYLKKYHLASLFVAVALVAAALPLIGIGSPKSTLAATTTHLYLSPASQSVTTGSNVVVALVIDTGGASINTVQSVVTYDPAVFSFVGITAGPAFTPPDSSFQGVFTNSESSGSIQFSAAPPVPTTGTVTPVTGIQTVVTITLHATGTGNASAVRMASICGAGNFASTCTAAYDATAAGNPNDLIGVATPITNGSYTVTAPVTTPPVTTPPATTPPATSKPATTNSGSSKSSSSAAPAPAPSTAATATPTTTATNPAPVISGIKVSSVSTVGAVVTWQTNIPASSIVNYGLNDKYGFVAQDSTLTTNHQVTIPSSLAQGTTYYFTVASAADSGASTTSGPQQFTTTGFTVTIQVLDKDGKPIKGAVVTADGHTATSNSQGIATLQDIASGTQTIVIKSGGKSTSRTITVGKFDPKTGTYQLQKFSLTAVRGSSTAPYVIVALFALLAAGITLFAPLDPLRRLVMQGIGKGGPGGMGHGSGSAPYDPDSTTSLSPPSSSPIQVITPGSEPSGTSDTSGTPASSSPDAPPASTTPPIILTGSKNPEPGSVVAPSEDKDES